MLKKFTKYVFQSVASMMGQSVYILADTFFIIGQLRSKWTGSPQPDPAGFWNHVRNRIHDRDRFCDEIRDPQSQR